MRVACYARYSSDLQRDTSIEDQLTVARRYAAEQGWTVPENQIYTDAGISGASVEGRPGLKALLAAAATQPRPFDVLLVDDSSRIARDIADAIRVLQQLKFLRVRVIYISQGIDSDSEQVDALVTVHGLIDSLYLKELAKKIKRGLAGQLERGFATGSKTYGYRTLPVPDLSGRKNSDGTPALLGKRIEIVEEDADIVRRIFEWAADGLGAMRIVERLNEAEIPGPRGGRWCKNAILRLLRNERYRGRQVWGQHTFEKEPGTNRRIRREVPREKWGVVERPDLRIISDELWEQTQSVRTEVRKSVAPKGNLARGRDARFHSKHLFTGFMKCGVCGGAITSVSGGKGSPRYGCRRSWHDGVGACSNRLTIRAKVADATLIVRLQQILLEPRTVEYVTREVGKALTKELNRRPERESAIREQLQHERKKLKNLVSAIEGGAHAPSLVAALREREATVERLQRDLASLEETGNLETRIEVLPSWVKRQLEDLASLLKEKPERLKAELRRLNLRLTIHPVEARPRPYLRAEGNCDLRALAYSGPLSAAVGSSLERAGRVRSWSPARFTPPARAAIGRASRSTAPP